MTKRGLGLSRIRRKRGAATGSKERPSPFVIVLQAIPVFIFLGAVAGSLYLKSYLAYYDVSLLEVAGLSDFTLSAFYSLFAIILLAMAYAAGFFLGKQHSAVRWFSFFILLPLSMFQISIIIAGSAGPAVEKIDGMGDDQLFMFKGNLEQLYSYIIIELQYLSNLSIHLEFFGIISISALLGWLVSWFVNVQKTRAIPLHWGGGIAFWGMILLAATPFGKAMAGSTLASSISLIDGKMPVYLFHAANIGAQLPKSCSCGAAVIWSGDKSTVLNCAGGEVVTVHGPDNVMLKLNSHRERISHPNIEGVKLADMDASVACLASEAITLDLPKMSNSPGSFPSYVSGQHWLMRLSSRGEHAHLELYCNNNELLIAQYLVGGRNYVGLDSVYMFGNMAEPRVGKHSVSTYLDIEPPDYLKGFGRVGFAFSNFKPAGDHVQESDELVSTTGMVRFIVTEASLDRETQPHLEAFDISPAQSQQLLQGCQNRRGY